MKVNGNKAAQGIIVLVGLSLVCVLYFFGKTVPPKTAIAAEETEGHENHDHAVLDVAVLVENALSALSPKDRKRIADAGKGETEHIWEEFGRHDIAADLKWKKAQTANTFEAYNHAGDGYIKAVTHNADSTFTAFYAEGAIKAYEKALELKDDETVKLKLAKSLLDLKGETMKGVLLLREIAEANPQQLQAQYELGLLSMQSGQWQKAVERFENTVKISPDFVQGYMYLAECQLQLGNEEAAVLVLKKGKEKINDPAIRKALDEVLNKILKN